MTKFSDFLQYYVNLDTGPFVEGAQKLMKYYFEFGVDLWKVSLSAPGVARRLLFEHAPQTNTDFASFSVVLENLVLFSIDMQRPMKHISEIIQRYYARRYRDMIATHFIYTV